MRAGVNPVYQSAPSGPSAISISPPLCLMPAVITETAPSEEIRVKRDGPAECVTQIASSGPRAMRSAPGPIAIPTGTWPAGNLHTVDGAASVSPRIAHHGIPPASNTTPFADKPPVSPRANSVHAIAGAGTSAGNTSAAAGHGANRRHPAASPNTTVRGIRGQHHLISVPMYGGNRSAVNRPVCTGRRSSAGPEEQMA